MKNNIKKILIILCAVIFTSLGAYGFSFRNMTLDFIDISDTHVSKRADTSYKALSSSKALLDDAISQINSIKGLDFVLFTGDLVDSGTQENFELYYSALSKLKYPSLNAFGNHEFYGDLSDSEVLEAVQNNNPNYTFSDTYYAITPKTDYRIIVLDSTLKGKNTSNGELTQEQLQFLDDELASNQDKIVVIAMHHPSVEPFAAAEHRLLNADEFNEILLKYKNPIVVLSGHYHAAKISRAGNIVFVSTPAMVTYPMAFRHIKIVNYKDRVNYKFDFIPTRLDDVREQNRQSVISYSTLAGLEKDRNLEFTYFKSRYKSARYKRNKIKNATKVKKTSKRELKKLSKNKNSENIQKQKVKKPSFIECLKEKKNQKEAQNTPLKEQKAKEKALKKQQKEQDKILKKAQKDIDREAKKQNKTSFKDKEFLQKFKNIFSRKKTMPQQEM